jgi:surface protein
MFRDCKNLETINFGNINTSLVENMKSVFYGCSKLTSIDLSKFDTSEVTTFY